MIIQDLKQYQAGHELVSHYNVQFTIDEAMDVEKISDIKRHLKNHGVNLDD